MRLFAYHRDYSLTWALEKLGGQDFHCETEFVWQRFHSLDFGYLTPKGNFLQHTCFLEETITLSCSSVS